MIIAQVMSGGYEWLVVAEDRDAADVALLAAYRRHVKRVPLADRSLMRELIDGGEVNYFPAALGEVLRDGSPIR